MSVHTNVTVTWTSAGVTYSTTMLEASSANYAPPKGERWYQCHVCALDYPRSEVVLRGGVAYCLPLKCYQDLPEYDPARR